MFLNHTTAFTTFAPAAADAATKTATHTATLGAQTLLETPLGWSNVDTLSVGDTVATLDGGFARITAISHPERTQPLIHVPGGVLSSCSDLHLPADTYVALTPPAHLSDAPVVSVPLKALSGWRGIRPTLFGGPDLATLHFEEEEMIYAQTGLLIHAKSDNASGFYKTLEYGDTRAMLSLIEGKICGPDRAAA
jgi:hypothetical protein